jgi:hypothetical protein
MEDKGKKIFYLQPANRAQLIHLKTKLQWKFLSKLFRYIPSMTTESSYIVPSMSGCTISTTAQRTWVLSNQNSMEYHSLDRNQTNEETLTRNQVVCCGFDGINVLVSSL